MLSPSQALQKVIKRSREVTVALAEGRPIVALESTLIAQGLPRERRLETARLLEQAVRDEGACPATIAIIDGFLKIGLEAKDLERLSYTGAKKASLADMAEALAGGDIHATTVASTMAIASRAGISVFATGGIGGVHRGVEKSFDESADLTALSRYPVAVVCAGPKAILDLPRTFERLETLGVPVVGYRTKELPAFYTARSGIPLAFEKKHPEAIARMMRAQFEVLGEGGMLVVQPPPAGESEESVAAHLAEAERRAAAEGVRGAALTPFLLQTLAELSGGKLVDQNIALVKANAGLAAKLAVAYSVLKTATPLA